MSQQRSAKAVVVLAMLLALASPVWAGFGGRDDWRAKPPVPRPRVLPAPRATPEIDPGVARGAVVLLVGGLLILHDRRRRSS